MSEDTVVIGNVTPKPPMDPVEIYRRNVRTMSPRQLQGHLRNRVHKNKKNGPMLEGIYLIVSAALYDNTAPQIMDDDNRPMKTELLKAFGTINPGIR